MKYYKYYLWVNKSKGIRAFVKLTTHNYRFDKINMDFKSSRLFERVFPEMKELTEITEEDFIRSLYSNIRNLKYNYRQEKRQLNK